MAFFEQIQLKDVGGTNIATVKAASTAPIATDTALVVSISPNSIGISENIAQIGGTAVVTAGVAGLIAVGGNVANGVAATANPVPVGGVFITTPATLTTGQTATLQFTNAQNVKHDITSFGGTIMTIGSKVAASSIPVAIATDQLTGVGQTTNALSIPVVLPTGQTFAGQNVATPTNQIAVGGQFNTAPTTITTGNVSPLQLDASGNLRTTQNATNIVLDANNSSSATLTAGSTFNAAGTGTDVSKYAQINITVAATQATPSPASMFVDFSTTNAFTVGVNTSSIPFFVWNNTVQQLNIPRFLAAGLGQFMRVRYLNDGGTAANNNGANGPTAAAQNQTALGLNVYLMPVATKEITIGNETSITPYDPAILVRNVPNDGLRFTYVGSNTSFAAVTTPTITSDLFTLQGSATKTIRVTRILYSSETGANQAQVISIMRRSVVSTGGAYTTVTPGKMDTFNSAATAVFKFATTGGTAATGTTVANLDGRSYFSSGGTVVNDVYSWEADRPAQAIVLRGVGDFLTLQIVSGTVTGLQFNCSVEWVEDNS